MNKLLFAIFLFGCSLAFATVDERKIDIYFANGIDTTRRQAELALFDINISYQVYNSTLYKSVGQWKVSYNTTHGIGIDLYESTLQKVYEDEPGTSFVPVFWNLPTVAGMFDIYFSNIVSKIVRKVARHSIKQYASTAATYLARRAARTYNSRFGRHFTEEELELLFDEVFDHLIDEGVQSFVNTTEDEIIQQERDDLNTQLNKYRQSIRRGHGVVVIAHSQGNFFTNRAFDEFGVSSNINHDLWMKNYFRALGVATPTDNVIGNNSPYITYDNDIIQLIPWSLPPNVPNPHRYGIENALGEQIVVDNTYSIEAHNFISSYMATPSTKAAILGYIGGEIVEHNNAQSQWQKAYDIGCPSSCEHRIGVSHKFDSSLDINMTGIDVLPFDETGKLYPLDNGTYVKADPEGKRVKALGSGLVCHELQNDQNATIDTIARGQSAPEPHGGAVEVTLSWGESGNDFDLDLDMPSSVRDVQSCMMEHEYVASEFEIYPGHYDVNVSYAGGEYRSDTCYVTIQVPGETQVLKFDTNGSGSNPRHVATIVVEYIDNRPVLRLSAAVPGSLIFSFGGSASGGNSTVNRIVHESEFIRYTPPTPYVCSPAMSCGCKPCEYTIVPDLAQVIKGPLSGADIALFNAEGFRNGTPLYSGKTGTGDDLYMAGLLNIPPSLIDSLDDNGLYIFEVSGGVDIDRDDDMRVDEVFTPNNAVLHAVLTGADLKAIKPKVSVLTEIAYQIVRDEIMVGTDPLRILDTLDDVATRLLSTKIYPNSPDPLNHTDLAQWLPTIDKGILFADYDSRIRPIIEKLQAQEDIYQDAYDVVYYPDGVAPVLKSALFDVPEDTPVGTVLGRISVMSEGQSPVIGMTLSGEGQEAFSIDAAGTVTLIQPLDYEQKQLYSLYVHAGNEQGVGLPVALYVQVGDVTDAPVITDFSARPVYSSFAVGRAVGQVSFSEGSSGVTSVRLGGADGGYFRADILGNITVAKQLENYLVKKVYRFSVTVSNLSGDSRPADIVLNVSDAQELPVLAAIDVNVTENSVAGTVIGTADVLSEGQSPITSFTLGGSSVFAINEQGDIIVTEAAQLDYEQRQTYELSVSAYNSFGESKAVNVTVHVNNVPDTPPQVISTSMSIDENSPAGTAVGVLRVTPGEAAVNTIGISGDGHEYFRADPDGTVRVAGSLDYESRSRFHLTFSATSILGTSNVSSLDIAVNNVPEVAPTLQATAVTRHFHEIGVGQTLANVLIDAGDTPVQVITLQPDSPFAVRPNGELYLAEALSGDQTEFNLTASAGNGFGLSDPVGVNIRVIATPVLSDTRLSVDENAPSGTVVGNVGIISEGMAAIESFSADSPLMTIDPDGTVHVASGADLDYEIRNHYDLNVSARNRFGVGASVRLSISVNNVPEKAPVLQDLVLQDLNITADKETAVGSIIGNVLVDRGDSAIEAVEGIEASAFGMDFSGNLFLQRLLERTDSDEYCFDVSMTNGFGAGSAVNLWISAPTKENLFVASLRWDDPGVDMDIDTDWTDARQDIVGAPCLLEHLLVEDNASIRPGRYAIDVFHKDANETVPGMVLLDIGIADRRYLIGLKAEMPSDLDFGHVADILVREDGKIEVGPAEDIDELFYSQCDSGYAYPKGQESYFYDTMSRMPRAWVEGPLVGASVTLHLLETLGTDAALFAGTTTEGRKIYASGIVGIPYGVLDSLQNDTLYLVAVTGGEDVDSDDDLKIDPVATPLNGSLHAVLSGEEIKQSYKVTVLTEMTYQVISAMIGVESNDTIKGKLDEIAALLIKEDVSGDGIINREDINYWVPSADKPKLAVAYSQLEPIIEKIYNGDDIYDDVMNLLYPNLPPIAVAGEDINASLGETVTLDASESYDPDGYIVEYLWLSDGFIYCRSEEPVCMTDEIPEGEHLFMLQVTDDRNVTAHDYKVVAVESNNTVDPELLKCVDLTLGLPPGTIPSEAQLLSITRLSCSGAVSDLSWLPNLPNLIQLSLFRNNITDITPLRALSKLESLDLSQNPISNIDVLGELTGLTFLALSEIEATDLSALNRLTNLTELSIGYMSVDNTTFLDRLTRVTDLYVFDTNLTSLRCFAGMSGVTYLYAPRNKLVDLYGIETMPQIARLEVYRNDLQNISAVHNVQNLQVFDASENNITDVSALYGLQTLVSVNLSSNHISDLAFLADLPLLEELFLNQNDITDVSPLAGLGEMKWLWLGQNGVTDIAPLASMPNLRYLDIAQNPVRDFTPLQNIITLHMLDVSGTGFNQMELLAELTSISTLKIAGNNIDDISVLQELTALQSLQMQDNGISDLAPLQNLEYLESIYLYWNCITDFSPVNHVERVYGKGDQKACVP